jgi:alpha-1,3-rhamnosyl/mannosyltransferase
VVGRDDVRIIAEDWPISKVARWLQSGDVLLYLSSGEGYGLMPLEAMATGLPVVCAANTGMLDYLDDEVAYPVSCRPAIVETYERYFGYEAWGFEPIYEAAVAQLRAVYDDRERALAVGRRAAQKAAGYTWERAARQALAGLDQLIGG